MTQPAADHRAHEDTPDDHTPYGDKKPWKPPLIIRSSSTKSTSKSSYRSHDTSGGAGPS
jgi:hypothetical protein